MRSYPLIRTKFYIPHPQPGLVRRPHLTQQLNEGLSRKLTLISAPAGFGKTTLLSEWIPISERPVAWLSLEEADNDTSRFWAYFIAALQIVNKDLGKNGLSFLESEGQPLDLESLWTVLVNDITFSPIKFVLVLDDYHHINTPAIHEGLTFLLDHLPPQMHLIITSRADPRLPLARLRARSQMNELRTEDLRFSSEEIVLFLNREMGLDLSAEDLNALEERTEGWIAGLQLAAISIRGSQSAGKFITSFTGSHRFILDYLVDEVLHCQAEDVQAFLLETSFLDRFNGSLCNAVTGREDGQAMLELLEQSNLFIIPLDNERRWYRYHHLFADLLRGRLQNLKPAQLAELHRRACEWFERENLLHEAVNHALTGHDHERAAQLMERVVETLRQSGEVITLTGWMDSLPSEIRRAHPALCLAYARALLDSSQYKTVESLVAEVEGILESSPRFDDPSGASLKGQIAALRAYLAETRNQFDWAIGLSHKAQELLTDDDASWRSFNALNLAGAYRFTSNWAAASQAYLEASSLSQAAGDKVSALYALSMRGEVLQAEGHFRQSMQQFEGVLQLARSLGIPEAPATSYALVGLGRGWYEWNDVEAALRYVQEGLERGQKARILDVYLRGYVVLARARHAKGDLQGALAALDEVEPAVRRMGLEEVKKWISALKAQLWLESGEIEAAEDWASGLTNVVFDRVFPSIAIALARVRLVQGLPGEALAFLDHALQSAESIGRQGNAVPILVVKALAYRAQGSSEEAFAALSKALALAGPEGLIRVFLDEGEQMRMLLMDLRSQIERQSRKPGGEERASSLAYIDRLLFAFRQTSALQNQAGVNTGSKIDGLVEPFSERELDILHLMAAGLSNRDIADRNFVSINTVKTQVKSIYAKLGTHNRAEALTSARELGLVPPAHHPG